jgi:hypothetical protein
MLHDLAHALLKSVALYICGCCWILAPYAAGIVHYAFHLKLPPGGSTRHPSHIKCIPTHLHIVVCLALQHLQDGLLTGFQGLQVVT